MLIVVKVRASRGPLALTKNLSTYTGWSSYLRFPGSRLYPCRSEPQVDIVVMGTRLVVWNGKPENCLSSIAGHVDDLFPYFMAYARWRFPEEASMTSLKKISDLTSPPAWYEKQLNAHSQYSELNSLMIW